MLTISSYTIDPNIFTYLNLSPTERGQYLYMNNGFRISKSKFQFVHFCSPWRIHNNLGIKLEGIKIPIVDEYKFFEVIVDKKKLSFIPHRKHLKLECKAPTRGSSHKMGSRPTKPIKIVQVTGPFTTGYGSLVHR